MAAEMEAETVGDFANADSFDDDPERDFDWNDVDESGGDDGDDADDEESA